MKSMLSKKSMNIFDVVCNMILNYQYIKKSYYEVEDCTDKNRAWRETVFSSMQSSNY